MKHIYTAFSFLIICTASASAQVTDTLFFKNFNDKSLTSAPAHTSVSFSGALLKVISSVTDTSHKINGTPSLAINPYASLYSQLISNNVSSVYKLFSVTVNNTGIQDSLMIGFSIKTKSFAGDLLNSNNRSATISAPSLAPVSLLLNYVNDAGESMQKKYGLYTAEPLNVTSSPDFYLNASESITSAVPLVADVMIRTKNNTSTAFTYTFSVTRPSASITRIVPNSGSDFTVTDANFKTTLLNNFCNTAVNPTSCKTFYTLTYVFGSTTEDYNYNSFIIDNLYAGGFKQLATGLSGNEQQPENKTLSIIKAYNILGVEIKDFNSYSGLAIVIYSDGRKAKILK